MKKIISAIIISLIIIVGFATTVRAEENVFSISDSEAEIELNSTKFLYCTNIPEGEEVEWTTTNAEVATVDEEGVVTGVGIGTATITATAGDEAASCEVTVVYADIRITGNSGFINPTINMFLGEHETEKLVVEIKDAYYENVENPEVEFSSSNENVATVNDAGVITAKSVGTATITVTAPGVTSEIEVEVYEELQFTDFSNAKYEMLFDMDSSMKISNITPKNEADVSYYYIITPDNVKPEGVIQENGYINHESLYILNILGVNQEENYIYDNFMDEYIELNQDLYLWILETQELEEYYYNENGTTIGNVTKFVVEGEKIERPELPKINQIINLFLLAKYNDQGSEESKDTHISFRFPTATENRKFTLKIGKVTDKAILQKIKNNDYAGITELLRYAKDSKSIYENELTTTSAGEYRIKDVLFDGKELLNHKEYYYIYAVFDDENGTYCPIEAVTLGQAWNLEDMNSWDLWAYNNEKFEWTNLSSGEEPKPDDTKAPEKLPDAGINTIFGIVAIALISTIVFLKSKNNYYKNI